ncbi:MAG TPA: hypothetical protein PKY20_05440, partial [Methanothrix sp.]|nr:hypothetical protein [Methanothrix sp.]
MEKRDYINAFATGDGSGFPSPYLHRPFDMICYFNLNSSGKRVKSLLGYSSVQRSGNFEGSSSLDMMS